MGCCWVELVGFSGLIGHFYLGLIITRIPLKDSSHKGEHPNTTPFKFGGPRNLGDFVPRPSPLQAAEAGPRARQPCPPAGGGWPPSVEAAPAGPLRSKRPDAGGMAWGLQDDGLVCSTVTPSRA